MKQYLLFIFLLFITLSFAQQKTIDSLIVELELKNTNKEKLATLEPLSKVLINSSTPEFSLPYYIEMAHIAKQLNNKKTESRAYKYIAECYMKTGDLTNAEKYALNAVKISERSDETNFYVVDINQLGRVYHHFQKYEKAIETYNKGLSKYNESPQGDAICTLLSNLGTSYGQIGDTEKQIDSYLKGAKLADKLGNQTAKTFALYNIAYLYMNLEQFEKSEEYFLNALKDSSKIELKPYVYMNFHGLGINYSRWGKYDKALESNKIALNYYRTAGNKLYEYDVLNNTAVVYQKLDKQEASIEFAKKALTIAEELNHKLAIASAKQTLSSALIDLKMYSDAEKLLMNLSKDTLDTNIISLKSKSAIYKNLSSVYESKNQYQKALNFYKGFKKANDSILKNERDSNVTEIETKYQTEKKEKENILLKADNVQQALLTQKANTQKWILALGLLAVVLSTFFIWRRYKAEVKAKQTISEQKDVIEELQKELHHRVKNNLSIIDAFVDETKEDLKDKELVDKLTELQNRIASINEVHRQLYQNKDVTNLKVKHYIESIAANVADAFNKENIRFQNQIDENLKLQADKSFPIGLIINEFMTNSYKYAFNEDEKGTINISIKESPESYLMSLSDNGKGLPKDFSISKINSFGMDVMKLLSKQLKGTFSLDGTNGVNLNIEFPKV